MKDPVQSCRSFQSLLKASAASGNVYFLNKYILRQWYCQDTWIHGYMLTYRVVLEEQVTPLMLNIEEEGEDQDDVDHGDEAHDDQATVHHVVHPRLSCFVWNIFGKLLSKSYSEFLSANIMINKIHTIT